MLSVPPHRSDPSTARTTRPPTSGGGGGGDGDDFGAWATNTHPPLGPPDGRIEGALPRMHRCADADRARCAYAKVLNAPHRSCGYKTGYRRYRHRPRYSRPHPHHPQTVTPGTPQDPTLARLPLLACLKLPTSKQRVSPSPEATTRRVPQPVGYPLTRAVKTRGMPGSQPAREQVRVLTQIPAGLPVPMPICGPVLHAQARAHPPGAPPPAGARPRAPLRHACPFVPRLRELYVRLCTLPCRPCARCIYGACPAFVADAAHVSGAREPWW
jgi:hypothetical protein